MEKSARKKDCGVSDGDQEGVSPYHSWGVKKYGLATLRMIEPGQKKSVVLLVRV